MCCCFFPACQRDDCNTGMGLCINIYPELRPVCCSWYFRIAYTKLDYCVVDCPAPYYYVSGIMCLERGE